MSRDHYYCTNDTKAVFDFMITEDDVLVKQPSKHNILVLDVSGSMTHVLPLLRIFTSEIIKLVDENNYLSIIVFGTEAKIILERQNKDIEDVSNKIKDGGGTNGVDAVKKINQVIQNSPDDFYNIVFLTDGCFNQVLSNEGFKEILYQGVGSKTVMFNSVGFTEYHDNQTLDILTGLGSIIGNYTSIYNDNEISSIVDNYVNFDNNKVYNVVVKLGKQEYKINMVDFDNWKTCMFNYEYATVIDIYADGKLIKKVNVQNVKDDLHIKTHVMREKLIEAFSCENMSVAGSRHNEFCELNDQLCQLIADYSGLDEVNEIHNRDIKILGQLNNDLSYLLEGILQKKIAGSSSQLLMKFANEHKNQYSISTLKNRRICYNSNMSSLLNLKLIQKMDGVDDIDRTLIEISDKDLYVNEKKFVDQHVSCYILGDNWRDDNCIGIGLHVCPKTTREIKRHLQPNVKMDYHYLSMNAYNKGVMMKFEKNPYSLFSDRDDPVNNEEIVEEVGNLVEGEKNEVMNTSINKGSINCWIPIYINPYHWSFAKYFVDSSISLIANQNNNMYSPKDYIAVYANLFIRNIVRYIEDKIMPDESVQMFCYLYRTLIELVQDKNLDELVESKLKNFIETPYKRSRRYCSNLGDLIPLMLISDKYGWDDMMKYYVPETIRRSIIRIENPEDLVKGDIVDNFSKATADYFKVSMMVIHLLRVIKCDNLKSTKEYFDNRWGLLSEDKMKQVKDGFKYIVENNDIRKKLAFLGFELNDNELTSLLLWAIKNRESHCELVWKKPISPTITNKHKSHYKNYQILQDFYAGKYELFPKKEEKVENKQNIKHNCVFFYSDKGNKSMDKVEDVRKHFADLGECFVNLKGNCGVVKYKDPKVVPTVFNTVDFFEIGENKYYVDIKKGGDSVKKTKDYSYKTFKRGNKITKVKGLCENKKYEALYGVDYIKDTWTLENAVDWTPSFTGEFSLDGEEYKEHVFDNTVSKVAIRAMDGDIHVQFWYGGTMTLNRFIEKDAVMVINNEGWRFKLEPWNCDNVNIVVAKYTKDNSW